MAIIDVRDNAETRAEPFALGNLTDPGVTDVYLMKAAMDLMVQFRVRDIHANVVVRAEGSLDGREWFNLDAGDEDYTITKNGIYSMHFRGYVSYFRFNWVSEDSESGKFPEIRNIILLIGVIS